MEKFIIHLDESKFSINRKLMLQEVIGEELTPFTYRKFPKATPNKSMDGMENWKGRRLENIEDFPTVNAFYKEILHKFSEENILIHKPGYMKLFANTELPVHSHQHDNGSFNFILNEHDVSPIFYEDQDLTIHEFEYRFAIVSAIHRHGVKFTDTDRHMLRFSIEFNNGYTWDKLIKKCEDINVRYTQ